jgi:hypothetical protein
VELLLLLLLFVFCSVVLSWRSKIERSFAAVFKFFIMERMLMDPYPLSFCLNFVSGYCCWLDFRCCTPKKTR